MNSVLSEERPSEETLSAAEISKNFRSFMFIWAAQLVARISNGLTAFGLAVYAYQLTGRASSVALVTIAAFLPAVALAPLGGVLADRFDRRMLMIMGDALSTTGLFALLFAFHTGFGSVFVICACVAFSSVFTSVMDPAYRATISDLLTPEQYARAGGLVQFATASQYLVSPAIAGVLMSWFGITVILVIDISTLCVTIVCMLLVWKSLKTKKPVAERGFWEDLRFGVSFLMNNRGITILMLLIALVTFCMGFLQTLLTPMMLDLSNEEILGFVRSAAAVGMVVASLAIGIFNMGNRHVTYLCIGLATAGFFIMALGATPNVLFIGILAFIFFMTLPPLNTSIEVMARHSIPNETQGKVWGLMALISQMGYIVAYAVSGVLADRVFIPLLVPDGALAGSLGQIIGVGDSRGIGLMFILIGLMLMGVAVLIPRVKSIQEIGNKVIKQTEK